MVTNIGMCKFCGKTQMVSANAEWTEEKIADEVLLRCDCENATRHRAFQQFGVQMDMLMGSGALEIGFKEPANGIACAMVLEAANAVYDGDVRSVTVQLSKNDRVTVTDGPTLTRREVREVSQ